MEAGGICVCDAQMPLCVFGWKGGGDVWEAALGPMVTHVLFAASC